MPGTFSVSDRTRLVCEADRAVYDGEAIYKILDEGISCHAGFAVQDQPFVIPTKYAHVGSFLYFHGSIASRRNYFAAADNLSAAAVISVASFSSTWATRAAACSASFQFFCSKFSRTAGMALAA